MPIKAIGAHKVDGDVSGGSKAKSPRCKRKANVDASGGAKAKSPKTHLVPSPNPSDRPLSSCEKAAAAAGEMIAAAAGENSLMGDATPPSSTDVTSLGSGNALTGSDVLGLLDSFAPGFFDGLSSPEGFLTTDDLEGLGQTDH